MRPQFDSWVGKIHWTRNRLPTPVFLGFSYGSAGKESACNVGDLRSVPELGRSPGEGKGYPLQYSGLENSMGCVVRGVAKSWTQMSSFQRFATVPTILYCVPHYAPSCIYITGLFFRVPFWILRLFQSVFFGNLLCTVWNSRVLQRHGCF